MERNGCTGSAWGFIASDVSDPPGCIESCRGGFLRSLLPESEALESVCKALSDDELESKKQLLWDLYCCDSQKCGVDNIDSPGQDPNVNWIINTCNDMGHHSVADPGPPAPPHECQTGSMHEQDAPRCRNKKPLALSKGTDGPVESSSRPRRFTAESIRTLASETQMTTFIATTTHSSMSITGYSAIRDPSLVANLDSPKKERDDQGDADTSTGVKAAIAVSVVIAVILLVALIVWHLRFRSRSRSARTVSRNINSYDVRSPMDSPTPLIPPAASRTRRKEETRPPPARLRERKLLQPISSPILPGDASLHERGGSLSSSRVSSSNAKSVARDGFGKSSASIETLRPSPQSLLPQAARETLSRGSSLQSRFNRSAIAASNTPTTATATNTSQSRPESPIRSSRSRDTSSEITGLMASPGPPPTRALPSTPPEAPGSPSSPPLSPSAFARRHGDIGVAIGVVSYNPAQGIVLPQESRDLCELTEEYARESRHSWGSWGGSGGGGPGVALSSPRKEREREGERDVNSPVIEEEDLEKLGGRY